MKTISVNPNRTLRLLLSVLCCIPILTLVVKTQADPVVTNIRVAQRPGTTLVDITCDLSTTIFGGANLSVSVSTNGGASYDLPATSFSGTNEIFSGNNKTIVWNMGIDWTNQYSTNIWFRIDATDAPLPLNMVPITAGTFTMGDNLDGDLNAQPIHTVNLRAFYMDKYLVTKAQWDAVYTWAVANGYSFTYAGSGKATNHPVHTIYWYDCVKWCNARSQKESLTPAYYTDAGLTVIYKSGQATNPYVNWNTGYRLPTEAEWEYAARGGLNGKRFPWGDTITHNQANYCSDASYSYDVSATRGYHPNYQAEGMPYTSPVGSFAANGYGLYDMAGNVYEWCWDWYGSYSSGAQTDPRGPASGSYRLLRGGSWGIIAWSCQSAYRSYSFPAVSYSGTGFRAVRPPGQ